MTNTTPTTRREPGHPDRPNASTAGRPADDGGTTPHGLTSRQRFGAAAAMAVVMLAAAGGYTWFARSRADGATGTSAVSVAPGPRIAFISTANGSNGRLATVAASAADGRREVSILKCTRLYAAGGTGLCLRLDGALTTYQIAVSNSDLKITTTLPLVGLPNRARVSPDGKLVAWTVFVTGDSYNGGVFSTRAGITNVVTGDLYGTLEDFSVVRDGEPYKSADENFWGVTFAGDDDTFYATMSTGGHRYLVQGSLAGHSLRTLRTGVECPSLSPDGKRIAFKQAIGGDPANGWHLAVLDLASGAVTRLAETRDVDDQAAWLGDDTVMYGIPRGAGGSDVWAVAADGTGAPRLLIPDAISPADLSGTG